MNVDLVSVSWMAGCLSICLCICLFVCPSVSLSVYLCVLAMTSDISEVFVNAWDAFILRLLHLQFGREYNNLFVCRCLSVCLYVHLSVFWLVCLFSLYANLLVWFCLFLFVLLCTFPNYLLEDSIIVHLCYTFARDLPQLKALRFLHLKGYECIALWL